MWIVVMTDYSMEIKTNLLIEGNITKGVKKLSKNDKSKSFMEFYFIKRDSLPLKCKIFWQTILLVHLGNDLPISYYQTLNDGMIETCEQVNHRRKTNKVFIKRMGQYTTSPLCSYWFFFMELSSTFKTLSDWSQ